MDSELIRRLQMQNMAAAMMKEMPESRHNYKAEGLPLEGLDPVFAVPVDFERILNTLWHDLQKLESHAIAANRYSEKYLSISRDLELMARKVGSLCITKAVLEQQGSVFNTPEDLTIPRLALMAGYHFNKAHAAADGTQMANLRFYLAMLEQETRWASLLCRLQATEDKIRLIREGKLEIKLIPEKENPEPSWKKTGCGKARSDESARVKAAMPASLPVDKELVRSAVGSDVHIAAPGNTGKAETSEAVIEAEEETKAVTAPEAEEKVPDTEAEPEAETPAETRSKRSSLDRYREEFRRESEKAKAETVTEISPEREAEERNMQNVLMYAAIRSADREAYEAALQARGPALEEMWRSFLRKDAEEGFPVMRALEMSEAERPPGEDDGWAEEELSPIEEIYA